MFRHCLSQSDETQIINKGFEYSRKVSQHAMMCWTAYINIKRQNDGADHKAARAQHKRSSQKFPVKNNIHTVYMYSKLTVNGVLKCFVKNYTDN